MFSSVYQLILPSSLCKGTAASKALLAPFLTRPLFLVVTTRNDNPILTTDSLTEFKDKKVVVVSVPGAFTPTCQVSHLASYVNRVADLKAKGVDQVVFIAYNDAFVMSAWGKANGIKDNFIIFASDPGAKFSSTHGWVMGERTGRYALVVDHGKVVYAAEDSQKGSIEFSGADAVLAKL